MSLFISYHLETDVKEHMGIETFWVNLGAGVAASPSF